MGQEPRRNCNGAPLCQCSLSNDTQCEENSRRLDAWAMHNDHAGARMASVSAAQVEAYFYAPRPFHDHHSTTGGLVGLQRLVSQVASEEGDVDDDYAVSKVLSEST